MSVNLVVGADLGGLADRLATLLAERPPAVTVAEVFATDLVAVPSIGVETWLVDHLASRPLGAARPLGPPVPPLASATASTAGAAPAAAPASVVTGIELVFPAAVIERALGHPSDVRQWPTVGSLTWAVHAVLVAEPSMASVLAPQPGTSLLARARSLADLLDRYLLHRPAMLRNWERSGPPPEHGAAHDQARLWLAVTEELGVAVASAQHAEIQRLAAGELDPELPSRLALFGVSSLPAFHREVLVALGRHREVWVLAPVVSPGARARILAAADPVAAVDAPGHRLVRSWAGANLESHVVLAGLADEVEVLDARPVVADTLLGRVQTGLRSGEDPRDGVAEPLAADDDSIRWHRCFGPARQAEVVADAVRHLLEPTEGGESLAFGDVAILCPDLTTFAPLLQAAFAGRDDVAEVPLVVTDLSLTASTPLLDATAALLGLLDGRFRPADVLGFAGRPPVARRFGLSATDLANLTELVSAANVAWGIDDDQRDHYLATHSGLRVTQPLGSRTWTEGLAQMLAGVALADRAVQDTVGLPVVPMAGLEDPGTVSALGSLSRLVGTLATAAADLAAPQDPLAWVDRLSVAMEDLVELADDDVWQWHRLERALATFRNDAADAAGSVVSGVELAGLLVAQLVGGGGRSRFGSGAVTLTSLTGLRGVPHRVVVLMGLDGDLASGGGRADDLLAADRLVGEPQPLREVRAQLLDAVLAATDRLLITSTGVDPRSNKEVAPSVPLAELLALFDDTAVGSAGASVVSSLVVNHPRHSWSTPNFTQDDSAVVVGRRWGFDAPALAAARLREQGRAAGGAQADADAGERGGLTPFGTDPGLVRSAGDVRLDQLAMALRNPAEAYLTDRLGVRLPRRRRQEADGLIPLSLSALDRYRLVTGLVDLSGSDVDGDQSAARGAGLPARLATAWRDRQAARGALPPAPFLADAVGDIERQVGALTKVVADRLAGRSAEVVSLRVPLSGGVTVVGSATVVRGGDRSLIVDLRPAAPKAGEPLAGLLTLATVAAGFPGEPWTYLQLRTKSNAKDPVIEAQFTLIDPESPHHVLDWAVDYRDHALAGFFPALPTTLRKVWDAIDVPGATAEGVELSRAMSAWGESETAGDWDRSDRFDEWVNVPGDSPEFEELWALPPTAIEADWLASGTRWRVADRRLALWAQQLWGSALGFAEGLDS